MQGLIQCLSEDLNIESLYSESELKLTHNADSVKHSSYGILLHHEFPRNMKEAKRPVVDNFYESVERPRQRTKHLVEKFLSLNKEGERILFVREERAAVEDRTVEELRAQLARLFPQASWRLTFVCGPTNETFGWKGDPALWDAELQKLEAALDLTHHRPFVDS